MTKTSIRKHVNYNLPYKYLVIRPSSNGLRRSILHIFILTHYGEYEEHNL